MPKLKKKRIKSGLSLAELGEKVGVTKTTIFRYESGKRKPNIALLKKIAVVLKCKVDDLI